MTLTPYAKQNGAIYNVDLTASPSRRWKEAASEFGDHVHALLANLESDLSDETPWWWPDVLTMGALTAIAKGARLYGGSFITECDSIAKTVEVDPDLLLAANLAYELMGVYARMGCSSVSYDGRDGHPVLARTLDWSIPSSIGEHSIQVRFHRGKECYDALTVAGFVGILSAQRPRRWAMTLNMAPPYAAITQIVQTPVCMHLRNCADKALSFDDLCDRIQAYQTAAPFFAHVIGAKRGERTVIAGSGDEYSSREPEDGEPLIITNHDPEIDYTDSDIDADFLADTDKRYEALRRRINRRPTPAISKAHDLLAREPVTCSITQHSMVLCPAKSHIAWSVLPNSDWEIADVKCPSCGCTNTIREGIGEYPCMECGEDFDVG